MCNLAEHIYKLRNELKDRVAFAGDMSAIRQMELIDALMAWHSHDCDDCAVAMTQVRRSA